MLISEGLTFTAVRERCFALPHAKEAGQFRAKALAVLRLNWMLPHGKTMR